MYGCDSRFVSGMGCLGFRFLSNIEEHEFCAFLRLKMEIMLQGLNLGIL